MNICLRCSLNLLDELFAKCKSRPNGLQAYCNSCIKRHYGKSRKRANKRYRNSAIGKVKQKEYDKSDRKRSWNAVYETNENRIASKERARKNYEQSEKAKATRRRYDKGIGKLRRKLRTRLYDALRCKRKTGSAIKDLGCTLEELRIFIESKFQPGMTWDNWCFRGWHIDHIRPLASFDLENREEFLKAVHYTNLQPLWAFDNLSKGAKYDSSLEGQS